jgi:minor extracellular serine protease Vpr
LSGPSNESFFLQSVVTDTNSILVPQAAFSPGVFTINSAGTGQGCIAIANSGGVLAAPVGLTSTSRPVSHGQYVEIYATGLGILNFPPGSKLEPASSSPLITTVTQPVVTIGGVSAPVSFSGLAPGFIGLYQVNVQVPQSAPVGNAVSMVLTIGGVTANAVTMAVQ